MLDPMPERTRSLVEPVAAFSKPVRILSKNRLHDAWKKSRDSSSDPGRPGIDNIAAAQFASKLESNLAVLAKTLREGTYSPSRLRAVFLPKPNSTKERLICIPTVRDRIVQRTIANYLVQNSKLPVENEFSFGFLHGRGTRLAIDRALELRAKHDWCVKTDIEAFFDRIPRSVVRAKIARALPKSSITPLLNKIIDCEILETKSVRSKLLKQGVQRGVGLRQGMPLSPLLANLALADFDAAIRRAKIEMIRYADDLLLFFPSKSAAKTGLKFVKAQLSALGLSIPELEENSKTQIVAPRDVVDFLGLELVFLGSEQRFVKRVGRRQIAKIQAKLEDEYNFETLIKEGKNFQGALVSLWRTISSYRGSYYDTHDYYPLVDSELRRIGRSVLADIFKDVFGERVLDNVAAKGRDFLGIGDLNLPEPIDDLDY